MAAWSELLARFITDENTPLELKAVDAPVVQTRADATVVEQEWRAMTDVHQFFTLLKRHNLTRQQLSKYGGRRFGLQSIQQCVGANS